MRTNDLTGMKFGYWTVIEKSKSKYYKCMCQCGNIKDVLASSLTMGRSKSCGCRPNNTKRMDFRDLRGVKFGRLTVVKRAADHIQPSGRKVVMWECECECGKTTTVYASSLTRGSTKSCGCLKKEKFEPGHIIHGGRNERLYKVWCNMKSRCYNPNFQNYKTVGAKGIRICSDWLESYQNFKQWALESGYNPDAPRGGCILERIDICGDYEPSNCRWKMKLDEKTS